MKKICISGKVNGDYDYKMYHTRLLICFLQWLHTFLLFYPHVFSKVVLFILWWALVECLVYQVEKLVCGLTYRKHSFQVLSHVSGLYIECYTLRGCGDMLPWKIFWNLGAMRLLLRSFLGHSQRQDDRVLNIYSFCPLHCALVLKSASRSSLLIG